MIPAMIRCSERRTTSSGRTLVCLAPAGHEGSQGQPGSGHYFVFLDALDPERSTL